jgi:hypothetical protein
MRRRGSGWGWAWGEACADSDALVAPVVVDALHRKGSRLTGMLPIPDEYWFFLPGPFQPGESCPPTPSPSPA